MGWKNLKVIRLSFLVLIGGLMSSCEMTIDEFCQSALPRFEKRTQIAWTELQDLGGGRKIASFDEKIATDLGANEVTYPEWAEWAQSMLSKTQDFYDALEAQPKFRKALPLVTLASNELVLFYGYSEKGNLLRMKRSLERMRSTEGEIRKLVCAPAEKPFKADRTKKTSLLQEQRELGPSWQMAHLRVEPQ